MTVYAATFSNVAVTAQQDFFEIVCPSGIVLLHRVVITQSTDVGDAAEEGLSIQIKRGATTSGNTGGTPVTAVAIEPSGPSFGTVEINNTVKATGGTIGTLHSEVWNIRGAFDWLPTPEMRPILTTTAANARATVELATTPVDSITCSGTLVFEWLGN